MAKINNQEVMQKLIDELKLYPGKDVIPSELAEKILAVYQVNAQDVIVRPPTANIVRDAQQLSAGTTTIYTTPATGKFYLTNVHLSTNWNSNGSAGANEVDINVTIDGTAQQIIRHDVLLDAAENEGNTLNTSLNLQNPVLVDASTNITIHTTNSILKASCAIVGYTEEDLP